MLPEKYNLYCIWFEGGFNNRPSTTMMIVHVARPASFKTIIEGFIFENPELTVESTNQKLLTSQISGIQKIPNGNKPEFELCVGGILKDVLK